MLPRIPNVYEGIVGKFRYPNLKKKKKFIDYITYIDQIEFIFRLKT